MNRTGAVGDGMLFFVFFFMMMIIGGGIAGGIYSVYGAGYDFREKEASTLMENFLDCFYEEDFSVEDFEDFDIYESCRFNKKVLSNNHLVYVQDTNSGKEFFSGVLDYKNQCGLEAGEKNKAFPKCKTKEIENFKIIVGSSQNTRRILTGWIRKDR